MLSGRKDRELFISFNNYSTGNLQNVFQSHRQKTLSASTLQDEHIVLYVMHNI